MVEIRKRTLRVLAIFSFFFSGLSFSQSNAGAKALRSQVVHFALKHGWQGYTYPSASRQDMPVLALDKAQSEAYADLVRDTFALMINRKFGWGHGLIRVGDVVFHMWGVGEGEKTPKVHAMNFRGLLGQSRKTEWYEAIQSAESAQDVSLMQQFFFYRMAIAETGDTGSPWWRYFVDRGQPNSVKVENCAGFVLSVFNPRFLENSPSAEDLQAIQAKAKKLAAKTKSSVKFIDPATFLSQIRQIPKKYNLDMLVSSPQSLMRLANSNAHTAAFVIHNSPAKDFVTGHKMGFSAKAGGTSKTEVGVDERKRDRRPLGGSSKKLCEGKLAS